MSTETRSETTGLQRVAENVWTLHYPLEILGDDHGRVVTILRLGSGKLIIHSTAPFSLTDVTAISALGEPGWLVDANLLHDTYAREGRNAFPEIPYLAPAGFAEGSTMEIEPLIPAPSEWQGEVEVALVEGMPLVREHVFFHRPSRTLIVGDLVSNFDENETTYEWLLRHFALGLHGHPDINRIVAAAVADKRAFAGCVGVVMKWDFDRLIVGHKQMIDSGAKPLLLAAVQRTFPDLQL